MVQVLGSQGKAGMQGNQPYVYLRGLATAPGCFPTCCVTFSELSLSLCRIQPSYPPTVAQSVASMEVVH